MRRSLDVSMKEIATNLKFSRWWLHLSKNKEYKAKLKRQNCNGFIYAEIYNITHVLIENVKKLSNQSDYDYVFTGNLEPKMKSQLNVKGKREAIHAQ